MTLSSRARALFIAAIAAIAAVLLAVGAAAAVLPTGTSSPFQRVPVSTTGAQDTDTGSVTLGLRFTPQSAGYVTGVEYNRINTGVGQAVQLWDAATGTSLATSSRAPLGTGTVHQWFDDPVRVVAGHTYVASYFAPAGHYYSLSGYWGQSRTGGALTAPVGAGVYHYAAAAGYPSSSFNNADYGVTPVFVGDLAAAPAATAPSAPTGVSGTAGNASAQVSWTAPANGGSAITSYTVTPFVGSTAQTPVVVNGSPPATSTTVSGLTNGTAYTFTVTATNSVGTSPASAASGPVTPTAPAATAPSAPTGVTATAGNASATVSWTAPANGGSPISSYTVTPFAGSTAQTPTTIGGSPPATSVSVGGLTNGTAYTFTVAATNSVGTGPASAPSGSVTPAAAPTGFPTAATTGVPAGTTLTAYTGPCTVTAANTVIDAKTINCDLVVQTSGVLITRSMINGSVDDSGVTGASFTVRDTEINIGNGPGTGIGDSNFTATRVHVHGGNRGVNCYVTCTVENSYVHGQFTDSTGVYHESGVRMGSNSTIRFNTILCDAPDVPPDAGCSADLTGYGDFATVQNDLMQGNLFKATTGGFCAYGGSSAGKPYSAGTNHISFVDNVFERGAGGKCGFYGSITSFDSAAPGNVWTNNTYDDGTVVPPAN